jgi:hypothetical protein
VSRQLLIGVLGLLWFSITLAAEMDHQHMPMNAAPEIKVLYESAFASYKGYKDEKTGAWRNINQQVNGTGHAGHEATGHEQHNMNMQHKPVQTMPKGESMPDHQHHEDMMH